jgi:glutamate dehydrogenase/leucine dehydrogenase
MVYQCYNLIVYLHTVHFFFRCVISGSGKIAMHVLEKLLPCGAIPVTVSGIQTQKLLD